MGQTPETPTTPPTTPPAGPTVPPANPAATTQEQQDKQHQDEQQRAAQSQGGYYGILDSVEELFGKVFSGISGAIKWFFEMIGKLGQVVSTPDKPATPNALPATPDTGTTPPAPVPLSNDKARAILNESFFSKPNDPQAHVDVSQNTDGTYTYKNDAGEIARANKNREQLNQELAMQRAAEAQRIKDRPYEPCPYAAKSLCQAHGYGGR